MKRCEKCEIEQFIIGKNLYYDQTFSPYFFLTLFLLYSAKVESLVDGWYTDFEVD